MTSPDLPLTIKVDSPVSLSLSVSQVVLGFVCEADYKLVAKVIRHRVTAIKRQRQKQRRLVEEAPNRQQESDPASPPAQASNQRPAPAGSMTAAGKLANQVCLKLLPGKQGRPVTHSASCWLKIYN